MTGQAYEQLTSSAWTWGQRVGVAASIALWVLILAVLGLGVTA